MGSFRFRNKPTVLLIVVGVIASIALLAWANWTPPVRRPLTKTSGHAHSHSEKSGGHDHPHKGHEHDHSQDHPGHDEASAIELSKEAEESIGLKVTTIVLRPFERTISVPAIVVERPGQSNIVVAATLTGLVSRVFVIEGEAIEPGAPLFEMRLTHEDLVQAQSEFLKTAEEIDVVNKELARLKEVVKTGAIAPKVALEREYALQKLEGAQRAQRQSLILHGLTEAQVDDILAKRELLQQLTVKVPLPEPHQHAEKHDKGSDSKSSVLQVQDLLVNPGQQVSAGDRLCVLANHQVLYIRGDAFAQDVKALNRAVTEGLRVSAVREQQEDEVIDGLEIVYLENRVDPNTRAFHFYVNLPNTLLRDRKAPDGRRFINWKFKPGERMHLQVPVEMWKDRIVLPITAVAQDGAESYVFKKFKDHFDRVAVHVEYRDARHVVIANDGTLKPGDIVSVSGAHQLHITLKNKAGGAADPHAGHNH